MSGECVSYDCPPCGDLCSTPYALPASPTAVSSGNTPEIYLSTASKDMYGIEKEAIEIYLKKVLNAENIYDLLENTTINSTDNLPYGTLGMISSTVQYNPVTGKKNPVRSDIFYDSTLPEDLQIYALLHELTHLEQLNYNSNMPLSFSEGDAEYNASALTGNGLDTIYDTEKGIFYNADKTYEKCKETVTGIYKAIGDGDIDSGRKQFYKAIERFGGDFYTALDSFDTSLNKDGINPEQIYDQLDSLDLEITQKTSYPGISSDTGPYGNIPPSPTFDIPAYCTDILPSGMIPSDILPDTPGIWHTGKKSIYDLLREQEEILQNYLEKTR